MGVSLAWVAVKGLAPDAALDRLELGATGETSGHLLAGLLAHPLPAGGFLVSAPRCGHRIALDESMARLSAGCEALCCNVEEHVDFASCTLWRDGQRIWHVEHCAENDPEDISFEGEVPPRFHVLLAGVAADADAGPDSYFHMDIPLLLAGEWSGFRHDADNPAFDALPFTVLQDLRPVPRWWRKFWR